MARRDETYDTQELLSLNMDRLKKYMRKWDSGESVVEGPTEAEKQERRMKRATRLIATGKLKRRILLVHPDPLHLSRMIATNDRRRPNLKLNMVWADDFQSAVTKMGDGAFRLVVMFTGKEGIPESDITLSSLDFLLLIHSLMAKDDQSFLLKKRSFVKHYVAGDTDLEKVTNFRLLKEDYRNTPFLFVHEHGSTRDSTVASRIHGVHTMPITEGGHETLLGAIDELVD
ncbi:MAG: hypothetical protein ACYS47_14100 [Planctomycetota bacterium]|jgi:hypothetical protein